MSKKSSTFALSKKKQQTIQTSENMKKINLNEICVAKLEKKNVLGVVTEYLGFKACQILYGKKWETCKEMLYNNIEYLSINTPDVAEQVKITLSEMEDLEDVLK